MIQGSLRGTEEWYQRIVESIPVGIGYIDAKGKINFANMAFCDLIGYSMEDVIGKPVYDFIHPDDKSKVLHVFHNKNTLLNQVNLELKVIHKAGHCVSILSSLEAITFNDEITGLVAVFVDITEREKQVLAYQSRLRSLVSTLTLAEERERRRIAVGVHDHISQNINLCRIKLRSLTTEVPDEYKERLDSIYALMQQVVEDVRSLTFELSSPILYELGFEAAVEDLVEKIETDYKLKMHFRSDGATKLMDDNLNVLIYQTVRELLINIGKHAQAKRGWVFIERYNDYLHILVGDDGVGLNVSGDAGGRKWKGKFGLMSIRERLCDIGGKMKIQSKPGEGTSISIYVPIKENEREIYEHTSASG